MHSLALDVSLLPVARLESMVHARGDNRDNADFSGWLGRPGYVNPGTIPDLAQESQKVLEHRSWGSKPQVGCKEVGMNIEC